MRTPERKIIGINLLQKGPLQEENLSSGPLRFCIQEHRVGWDLDTAEAILKTYDGYADGFTLSGIFKHIGVGNDKIYHPGYVKLLRTATKTPIYTADELQGFFSEWTLKKVLQEQPQIFFGKKVLFQCATATSLLPQVIEAGGTVWAADSLYLSGIPILIRGEKNLTRFYRLFKGMIEPRRRRLTRPQSEKKLSKTHAQLTRWIEECDVFVGFGNMLASLPSFEVFKGKILILDDLDVSTRQRLERAQPAQIIEGTPESPHLHLPSFSPLPIITAMIDLNRAFENSPLSFSEYVLKWIGKRSLSPRPLRSSRGIRRRCAFIIHPLTQNDYWRSPYFKAFQKTPHFVRGAFEKGASRLPCLYIGELTGVVSEATGQEVECDFYGLPATPREILRMKEEVLYERLVQCSEMARRRGAGLLGLGAYTKVAGDGGVSVARQSRIPITTGNSYSASTTMWAAREVMEKLDLIPKARIGNRFQAKAMIIGATGSIGRVSSLLGSLAFQELVLVANRPDRLLELREEILRFSPEVKVSVTTQSDSEISDMDLIVTATSNQVGSVLNMNLVKPGAVICDCSRPMDISKEDAALRPDVLVIESGEIILPGNPQMNFDLGLPYPSVYACTAETVLLALEGRFETFSISKHLSLEKTKEIYKMGVKHGAKLSAIRGPLGLITDEKVRICRALAIERLRSWDLSHNTETRHLRNVFA